MRKLAIFVAAALVFAACSSGSDGGTETSAGQATEKPAGQATEVITGGSRYCDQFQDIVDKADAVDYFDEDVDPQTIYEFFIDSYKQLRKSAPSELDDDFATLISGLEKYVSLSDPTSEESPLTEAEDQEMEAAGDRIADHAEKECGITIDDTDAADDSIDVGTDKDVVTQEPGGDNQATQTISLGGETYTDNLSGDFDVSCDMYGDLETGSIGVYLEGPEFASSVASLDSGVEPGTYEGQIWVSAIDPDLDEKTWDLQEAVGAFILERAEKVNDEEWLFSGSFSVAAENDPATSIEATFTCVGLVGF